jgi:hypothetical protein
VFPSGFQSHASTETCPGHSTLLTGVHPARTGIIANTWYDMSAKRADKNLLRGGRERQGFQPSTPVVSAKHLKVPTLGEYVKKQWPKAATWPFREGPRRGDDGRPQIDTAWCVGDAFTSFAGAALPRAVIDTTPASKAC